MTPFVGRTRELARLRRLLEEGHSIVLTGRFGAGRTALVRALARRLRVSHRFVFLTGGETRHAIDRLIRAAAQQDARQVVAVLDDVAKLTPQRLAFLREQTLAGRASWIVVADRSIDADGLLRLRSALGAAALVRLGPLGRAAAERCAVEWSRLYGLGWDAAAARDVARTAHGVPLVIRLGIASIRHGMEQRAAEPSERDRRRDVGPPVR